MWKRIHLLRIKAGIVPIQRIPSAEVLQRVQKKEIRSEDRTGIEI